MPRTKMQDIENTLKTRIQSDQADTFVVIVPTDSARLHRQRELVGYHPNGAVADLNVLAIENFVQRLYNRVRPPRQPISQGIQNLWLYELANNTDTDLYEEFRPNPDLLVPDSTLSHIADTINHLKEYGDDTPKLGNGESQNPNQDALIRIYKAYETKLEDRWIDEQGKSLHLANADNLGSLMREAFRRKVNLVVVEGFTVLSKAHVKILTRIAEMPDIEMWFRTDCVEENQHLYKNIVNLVSQFRDASANIDADYGRDPEQHQHYANNLFRTDNPDVTAIAAPHIKVLKPTDRSEEVEQIAHLIKKQVSAGDCKLSEICVACYNIGPYQQRIAEIFPTYGIRYTLLEGIPLTKSEVVKAIFSRLSANRTPLGDAYFSADVEPASPTRGFHPKEFQRYVDTLLKKGEVVQNILNPMLEKNSEIVEGEVEAYRQFKRILKELCSVLKSESENSRPLDEYIEKLHHIAKRTNYQSRATSKAETVKIARLGELRNLAFNTVFLCDFVEGSFPENYRPDPLLPDHPYRTEAELLQDNRFMFYGVLKSFRQRLYLLVPQREREAELIASPFLGQLKAIADIKTEAIPKPSQGSVSGFLSMYGTHIWTTPTAADGGFPPEIAKMRPLIDHVVAVEKSREDTHEKLAYEGILTVENREQLDSRRRWTYSVTDLETYARCPFQYFANNVLKLGIKGDEVEEELSSLERGSLLHKVLFTFYYNRRERGDPSIPHCTDDDFEAAKCQLNAILKDAAEERREDRNEPPIGANNLLWQADIVKLRVALHKWLAAERAYDLPVMPSFFEVSFGQEREPRDPELSRTVPISIGNVRMTGKIDRIDISNGAFNVIDYKTGSSTIRMPEILSGRSLQLPIYLQVAKKLLDKHGRTDLQPASGLYHKIRLDQCTVELGIGTEYLNGDAFQNYNGTDWRSVSSRSGQLLDDEVFDDRLRRVSGYVQQYVDSIANGNFPLITRVETFIDSEEEGDAPITPRDKTAPCNYCDYKRLCRVGAISEGSPSDD